MSPSIVFQILLDNLLYLCQMLGGNLVTGVEDLFTIEFKDHGLFGSFAHLALKQFLELLTLLDAAGSSFSAMTSS